MPTIVPVICFSELSAAYVFFLCASAATPQSPFLHLRYDREAGMRNLRRFRALLLYQRFSVSVSLQSLVLSDAGALLTAGWKPEQIAVSPPDYETRLGACSLDLRSGNQIYVFRRTRQRVYRSARPTSIEVDLPASSRCRMSRLSCTRKGGVGTIRRHHSAR